MAECVMCHGEGEVCDFPGCSGPLADYIETAIPALCDDCDLQFCVQHVTDHECQFPDDDPDDDEDDMEDDDVEPRS